MEHLKKFSHLNSFPEKHINGYSGKGWFFFVLLPFPHAAPPFIYPLHFSTTAAFENITHKPRNTL